MRALAEENGARAISDHLGFTRDGAGGFDIGHFVLPPFTAAAFDTTCRNLEAIQDYFRGLPFYLENIAYLFRFQGAMSESDFLTRVLNRSECGWLLDVTNLYANALNHGYDAGEFLAQVMPSARRIHMHLSGGYSDPAGMYIDSHSYSFPMLSGTCTGARSNWAAARLTQSSSSGTRTSPTRRAGAPRCVGPAGSPKR